jgi:outer membrane lipoprotein carrier protein
MMQALQPTLVFMAAGVLCASASAKELTADRVVAHVQRLYDTTKDFSADFEQEYQMKALARSQKSTGRVTYRKPGKIRFEYLQPQSKTFAVDGATLWVFQPQDGQALVDRCFNADGLTASLVFLGGRGQLHQQFVASLGGGDGNHHAVRLVPRTPQAMFQSVVLYVDRKTFEVQRSEVEDPSGNTNHFTFQNVQRNKGLKDAEVVFTPPPGVAVNPVPGSCPAGALAR